MSSPGPGRRELLTRAGGALLGLTALNAVGCGGHSNAAQSSVKHAAAPIKQADIALLNGLLEIERRTVAAYTAGIPLLRHPEVKTARQFLDEELQHTGELLALITAGAGEPVPRRASYGLGHPTDAPAVLELLHRLEHAQIVAYLAAIPRLSPGPVRGSVASILTNDAQHLALLRLAQGQSPTPSAFVTGNE